MNRKLSILFLVFISLFSVNMYAGSKKKTPPKKPKPVVYFDGRGHGIDISHHQTFIDWGTLTEAHPEIQFVYIRATYGIKHEGDRYEDKDSLFLRHIKDAKKTNLKIGVYHYFRNGRDPRAQFENFKKRVNPYLSDISLLPMVDAEDERNFDPDDLDVFLALAEKEWGVKPLIYTNQRMYNNCFAPNSKHYRDYPFFIAKYHTAEPCLDDGREYYLWQYTCYGKLQGIPGYVDFIRFTCDKTITDLLRQKE